MKDKKYFMESEDENKRLYIKTEEDLLVKQARWAGIQQDMRICDVGCGPGKTTYFLSKLTGTEGECVGLDVSESRIEYAVNKYGSEETINFLHRDAFDNLEDLGQFDFVWVRFLLEYYKDRGFELLKNIDRIVKPGGVLCVIDLDCNCLNNFGVPERLQKSILGIAGILEDKVGFDPYAGRKLYTYIYDLNYHDIDAKVMQYNLLIGDISDKDSFNFIKKIEVAGKYSGYHFNEYNGNFDEFYKEFNLSLNDPRRFSYTPLICCRGRKPNPS